MQGTGMELCGAQLVLSAQSLETKNSLVFSPHNCANLDPVRLK